MVPERIEREIVIEAPVEVVWSIVTEAEHVGTWFSDAAEIELRPGGEGTLTWTEHGTFHLRVEEVHAPHFFSFRGTRRPDTELRAGDSTLVEFHLRAEGESTRLRVVESGFRELDGTDEEKATFAEGNERGWEQELGELREYVSQHLRASAVR
jgi:uncharacterized protein YndB with AHSA1/START domain